MYLEIILSIWLLTTTIMIGKEILLWAILKFSIMISNNKNGLHCTTRLSKMSLLIANNLVQDSGHLINALIKSIIHNSTTSTCITTKNTHNLSPLIQNTLHVLPVTTDKSSTWKTWIQEPTTLLSGTKNQIKDITFGICNHMVLQRQ